ncbi:MAG: LEA type 2 family protein [Chitinophagaceae bacterium]
MNILIKNSSLSLFILILFLMLSAGGCNDIQEIEYKGIKNSKLEKLDLHNTAIRLNLNYYNPNNFGLDIKETNLSVYLNDKFVGLADQPEKTQIPKQAEFLFPVVAHFDPLKIIGTAITSLFSKTNKVTLQGHAKIGKGGVYIKIPINITENVSFN